MIINNLGWLVHQFLRASAMLKHVIDIGWSLDVRLSVRPSHAGILSKRLNIILPCFLHHTIAHSF